MFVVCTAEARWPRCWSLSSLRCLPGDLCVDGSLNTDKAAGVTGELRMLRLKQILTYDREVKRPGGVPTEPYICRSVGSHLLGGKVAHIAESLIKLQFPGQI